MKTYPKMKDSGVEWIDKIPEDWNINRLRFLADITTGEKDTIDSEEDGEFPFFVRSQQIEKISSYSCDEEAVLTAGDGVGVGKVVHYVNGKFDFHQRVYKMSNFRKINGKFFYYFFKENFKKEVFKGTAKSTVDSLRRHMIQDFPVVFGNESEQKQIVEFLDKEVSKIDLKLQKNTKLVDLLKEKRKKIINQTITKGLDPSVPMKDSGIMWMEKIPEHWKITKLKRMLTLLKDGTHNPPARVDEGVLLLSSENIRDGYVDYKNKIAYISKYDYNEIQKTYEIQKEDVLLTIVGTIGRCAVVKKDIKFSVQRSVAILRPNKEIRSNFLFYILQGNIFQNQLRIGINKTAQSGVYLGELKNISIILPSIIDEQERIIEFLDKETKKIDELIQKTNEQSSELNDYHHSLITSAVTGKIDVRGTIA